MAVGVEGPRVRAVPSCPARTSASSVPLPRHCSAAWTVVAPYFEKLRRGLADLWHSAKNSILGEQRHAVGLFLYVYAVVLLAMICGAVLYKVLA